MIITHQQQSPEKENNEMRIARTYFALFYHIPIHSAKHITWFI